LTTVVLTRKGQTTIPQRMRDKYGLTEGTRLEAIDTGEGILFRKAPSTVDLAGTSRRTYGELQKRLDRIRREDV